MFLITLICLCVHSQPPDFLILSGINLTEDLFHIPTFLGTRFSSVLIYIFFVMSHPSLRVQGRLAYNNRANRASEGRTGLNHPGLSPEHSLPQKTVLVGISL